MEAKVDPLRHHILEAVECLRQRKCRPDRESIAHYVLRKFGSTMNEIFAELENIVDENGLIKVEYKGTTSYRNPQNFDTKNSPLLTKHSKVLNSSKTTRLILSAINELLVKDPNYTESGVPLDELRQKLVEFDGIRFTEETMNIVLEREICCGGILMGKSDYLTESLRVFPKDLPVPDDMHIVGSLNADNSVEMKEEKKPKKTRKSKGDSPEGKKPKKYNVKVELEEAEDISEQAEDQQELLDSIGNEDNDMKPPSHKNSKLTSMGRKIVAEKVAEAVRKSYESTTEFETTSAQMIKLASAVVTKQVESTIEEIPKGPSLVLASSIINHSIDDKDISKEDHLPSNGEAKVEEPKSDDITIGARKRRNRASTKCNNGISATVNTTSNEKSEESEVIQTAPKSIDEGKKNSPQQSEQGLTRSKRDKRKKQVFDPSDPNTYSRTASKKARLSEPVKKSNTPVSIKRGRKSVPAIVEELTLTPANAKVGRGNLRRKAEASIISSTESSSQNKLDSSVSDGSNKMETEEETSNKEISVPKSSPLLKLEPVTLLCSSCQTSQQTDDAKEDFLSCSSCHTNFHPRCLNYSIQLVNRIRKFGESRNMEWYCIQCKICGICHEKIMEPPTNSKPHCNDETTSKETEIVFCESCDVGFHAKCLGESYMKSAKNKWICATCTNDKQPISPTVMPSSVTKSGRPSRSPKPKTVTPEAKKAKSDSSDDPKSDLIEPNPFPDDLRLWSKENVEKYFVHKGLKEEAANLLRQEVDGYSLLLLQREDIVNGLGFRLGPALKVYRLIHELQLKAPIQPHSSWTDAEGELTER